MQHKFLTLKASSGAFAFLFCFSLLLGCASQTKTVQAASDADAPTHIVGIDPGHQGPNVDMSDLERVEAALEEKVRPALRAHGGDIAIDRLEGKTLYVKMLGQCAGCPSADLTNETVVEAELTAALPEVVEKVAVVQTVSDELWEQAKKLLREHHL